jgi:hypothetical protein
MLDGPGRDVLAISLEKDLPRGGADLLVMSVEQAQPGFWEVGQVVPVENQLPVNRLISGGSGRQQHIGQAKRLGHERVVSPASDRVQLVDYSAPFGAQLCHRMVPCLSLPASRRAQPSDLASFDLDHQQASVGAQDQKVTFSISFVIVTPADNPLVRQPGQELRHAQFRFVAAVQRPVVDPFRHGPLLAELTGKCSPSFLGKRQFSPAWNHKDCLMHKHRYPLLR